MLPKNLTDFIQYFSRLPGIGQKTSERIGFYLIFQDREFVASLSESMQKLKENIKSCSICGNLSDQDPCDICQDVSRESKVICVVENAIDIYYIESTNSFHGLYHVLGGVLSPLNGITPKDLHIESLIRRVHESNPDELIFATSATTEGDTTVLYIKDLLKNSKVKITHLARGIPVGTGLQYAGSSSVVQAIISREEVK